MWTKERPCPECGTWVERVDGDLVRHVNAEYELTHPGCNTCREEWLEGLRESAQKHAEAQADKFADILANGIVSIAKILADGMRSEKKKKRGRKWKGTRR